MVVTVAESKPGDPGQAGTYDPTKGGKFEPTIKAQPAPENPHAKPKEKPKQ